MSAGSPRNPVACGALGDYDEAIVAAMAAAFDAPMRFVHADRRCALMLDRDPIAWRGGLTRGLAWNEDGLPSGARPGSWREAACEANACGLVVRPRGPFAHASVSGRSSVYHARHGNAVYFASRIDPLARALPGRLSVDWEGWSSIFCMRLPVGARTPFAEIGRLGPFETLSARGVQAHDWPWAQVEPTLDVVEGSEALEAALRESLAPVERATALLSGGLDSRLLTAALAGEGIDVEALTIVPDDGGKRAEHELAADVASRLAVRHQMIERDPSEYWEEWRRRCLDSDFQFISHPWLAPLLPHLKPGRIVVDGLAIDTLAARGGRHYAPEMFALPRGRRLSKALWRDLRRTTAAQVPAKGFQQGFARAVVRSSRRQFGDVSAPFRGHLNELLLLFYLTRTMRGVALFPQQILGASAAVRTPATHDAVVRAFLAIDPRKKLGYALYDELFRRLGPEVAELPSSAGGFPSRPAVRPQARFQPEVVAHYQRLLLEGPLAPVLEPGLLAAAREGRLEATIRNPGAHRATIAIATFHLWAERYGAKLRAVDPRELLAREEGPMRG